MKLPAQRAGLLKNLKKLLLSFAPGCHSSPCKARGFPGRSSKAEKKEETLIDALVTSLVFFRPAKKAIYNSYSRRVRPTQWATKSTQPHYHRASEVRSNISVRWPLAAPRV